MINVHGNKLECLKAEISFSGTTTILKMTLLMTYGHNLLSSCIDATSGHCTIKFITAIIYGFSQYAKVFVPDKPFQPSLKFMGEARSLPRVKNYCQKSVITLT